MENFKAYDANGNEVKDDHTLLRVADEMNATGIGGLLSALSHFIESLTMIGTEPDPKACAYMSMAAQRASERMDELAEVISEYGREHGASKQVARIVAVQENGGEDGE